VGKHADIPSYAHRDASSSGDDKSLARLGNRGWRWICAVPAAIPGNSIGCCESRAISHTVFPHQLEDFRRAFSAMLDGVNACQNGPAHAFRGVCVSGNNSACAVRGLDGSSHFSFAECRMTRLAGAPVVVRIQLDDIGAGAHLVVNCYTIDWKPGSLALLSSDGLHGVVGREELEKILRAEEPLETKCRRFIEAARKAGAPDNVTAVLLRRAA